MRIFLLAMVLAAGCGESVSGETANGTLQINFGDSETDGAVGVAIQDPDVPGNMGIVIGGNHIDCAFDEQTFFEKTTFVAFSADKTTPGTDANASVNVTEITSKSYSSDTANGTVTIDAIADRVTGSVSFTHADADDGTISVTGTFDVKKCF
jgi:hypothetical protein